MASPKHDWRCINGFNRLIAECSCGGWEDEQDFDPWEFDADKKIMTSFGLARQALWKGYLWHLDMEEMK